MAKKKTKLEKMSKDERTSLAYALATNLAKHGTPQTPKNERKLTKGEEGKKEKHVMKFKDSFDLEEQFSDKHDDNPALKGKQSKLPDALQKALIKKSGGKVDEAPMDINDPILIKQRADKMKREKEANTPSPKPKKTINPKYNEVKNASKIKFLQKEKARLMRDMEQEAEPEGGPIADRYGAKLNRIDKAIAKLKKSPTVKEGLPKGFFDKAMKAKDEKVNEDYDSLVSKLKKQGKSKKAAKAIAGAVASYKAKGGGKGPTAKQK